MNSNKHPGRKGHRHTPRNTDNKNQREYRITGSWNNRPNRPAVKRTQDRRHAMRIASNMATLGAYVIVEEHRGAERWRTIREIDGPALLAEQAAAERRAAEKAAAAERDQRIAAALAEQVARRAAAEKAAATRSRAAVEHLMRQPPGALDNRARHTTGRTR